MRKLGFIALAVMHAFSVFGSSTNVVSDTLAATVVPAVETSIAASESTQLSETQSSETQSSDIYSSETQTTATTINTADSQSAPGTEATIISDTVQTQSMNVDIRFPINKSQIIPGFDGNAARLDSLSAMIDSLISGNADIKSITLSGYASPEGRLEYNKRLSTARANSLKKYIAEKYHFNEDSITTVFGGENWDDLRTYVENSDLKYKNQVLRIIDSNVHPDKKLAMLKAKYPSTYRYLFRNAFGKLRYTSVLLNYTPAPVVVAEPEPAPVIVESTPEPEPVAEAVPEPEPVAEDDCDEGMRPILAVKNNLLYDAALAPNLEVERWFGKNRQWSVMAEWQAPWYVWHHNSRAYEILNVGVEGRYWLNAHDRCHRWLTGAFVGAFVMSGKYDIEWASKGYQGEYLATGVSAGFAHRLGRRWNMEYSLGVGYFNTKFRRYHGMFHDRHLIWQYNGNSWYAGPLKAKVSLVYLLDMNLFKKNKNKRKGGAE